MPPSYSVLALDTAGRLDHELATLARCVDDMRDLIDEDSRGSRLIHALARIIVTAQLLRTQTLDTAISPNTTSIEVHEDALRARMNIAVRALFALKQHERWISLPASIARFRSLHNFSAHMIAQLAEIHCRWLEHCRADQRLDQATGRALAYAALDDAEIAFERLGRDPDVEQFLRLGVANGCAAIATACRELATMFGVTLTPNDATATSVSNRCGRRTAS